MEKQQEKKDQSQTGEASNENQINENQSQSVKPSNLNSISVTQKIELVEYSNNLQNATGASVIPQAIDLESDNLSYNQVKKIRLHIEKDVELLRNRVRMLQLEEERAMKKISETKKKTKQIQDLKQTNDNKFHEQITSQLNNNGNLRNNQSSNYDNRQKQTQTIKDKQFKMYEQKRNDVEQVKSMKKNNAEFKQQLVTEQSIQNQERKNFIKAQKEVATFKKNEFLTKKINNARKDTTIKLHSERQHIQDYEIEAQQLEQMEAEMLQKLQETQQIEKDAFSHLESAMIDASMPKKMRVLANTSQFSHQSGKSKVNKQDIPQIESSVEERKTNGH